MNRIEPRTVVTLTRAIVAMHTAGIPLQKALAKARVDAAAAAGRDPENEELQRANAEAADKSIRRNRLHSALCQTLSSLASVEQGRSGRWDTLLQRLERMFEMAVDIRRPGPANLKAQLAALPFTREFVLYANAKSGGVWLPDWHTGPITDAAPPPPVSFNAVYRKLELVDSLTFDEKELLRDALMARRLAMGSPSVPRRTA